MAHSLVVRVRLAFHVCVASTRRRLFNHVNTHRAHYVVTVAAALLAAALTFHSDVLMEASKASTAAVLEVALHAAITGGPKH